jgi:hypothetical protein
MVGRLYKAVIRYFKPVGDTQYATCVLCDKHIKYARKDSTLFPECMLSHMSRIHPHIHINKPTAEKNSDPTKSLFYTKPQMGDLNPLPSELQTLSKTSDPTKNIFYTKPQMDDLNPLPSELQTLSKPSDPTKSIFYTKPQMDDLNPFPSELQTLSNPLVNVYPLEERPARSVQQSLRPGASYQLRRVEQCATACGVQQLWTMLETGTTSVYKVWAPKTLALHTENGCSRLNAGAVSVLKHVPFEYKGFTTDVNNIPHYTFRTAIPVNSTPSTMTADTPKQPPPLFAPHAGEVKNA